MVTMKSLILILSLTGAASGWVRACPARDARPRVLVLTEMGTNPDGDSISFLWFHYPEAGTYKELVTPDGAENADRFNVTAPKVVKSETLHFILRMTDRGTPALSR